MDSKIFFWTHLPARIVQELNQIGAAQTDKRGKVDEAVANGWMKQLGFVGIVEFFNRYESLGMTDEQVDRFIHRKVSDGEAEVVDADLCSWIRTTDKWERIGR